MTIATSTGLWRAAIALAAAGFSCTPRTDAEARDASVPFATCTPVRQARSLDLRRPGISAQRCRLAAGLTLAILTDENRSWPVVQSRGRPPVSLENPIARRQWRANATALRLRVDKDGYRLMKDASPSPRYVVYSNGACATDETKARCFPMFVALRLKPAPCALAVGADEAQVTASATDRTPCLPEVEDRRG